MANDLGSSLDYIEVSDELSELHSLLTVYKSKYLNQAYTESFLYDKIDRLKMKILNIQIDKL